MAETLSVRCGTNTNIICVKLRSRLPMPLPTAFGQHDPTDNHIIGLQPWPHIHRSCSFSHAAPLPSKGRKIAEDMQVRLPSSCLHKHTHTHTHKHTHTHTYTHTHTHTHSLSLSLFLFLATQLLNPHLVVSWRELVKAGPTPMLTCMHSSSSSSSSSSGSRVSPASFAASALWA
jgi:hypothetical protein